MADFDRTCAPKADLLGSKDIGGETAFLVRLMEDGGAHTTYHFKRYGEFQVLDGKLRQAVSKRMWGEEGTLKKVPEFPSNGTFGFRRVMSKMGASSFSQKQYEALQLYLEELMKQIPTLASEHELQEFFKEMTPSDVAKFPENYQERYREEQHELKEMLTYLRSKVSLQALEGYWRVESSDKIWQLEPGGRASLDGVHHGPSYDLSESREGSERIIERPDGWRIDIERSTDQRVVWGKPGNPDLVWLREDTATAEAKIDKIVKVRARLEKLGAVCATPTGTSVS